MSALLELAERCEKAATGEDVDAAFLDLDIHKAVNPDMAETFTLGDAPAYAASLDAAMTLVPEGWGKSVTDAYNEQDAIAELWQGDGEGHSHARAKTWPLALCAAALRARAAQ